MAPPVGLTRSISSEAPEFALTRIDLTVESNQNEFKKKMIGNFRKYIAENELDLQMLWDFKVATEGENLVWLQVNKLFDENESELEKYTDYFRKLHAEGIFTREEIQRGYFKVFNMLPDIESDIPHLPKILSYLLFAFCFTDPILFDFHDIQIKNVKHNEDILSFEIYAKVIAVLTEVLSKQFGFERALQLFSEFHFKEILEEISWTESDEKADTITFLKEEFSISD